MKSGDDRRQLKMQVALAGVMVSIILILGWCLLAGSRVPDSGIAHAAPATAASASAKAFLKAAAVLLHPRCVNCHPAGDRPLVGDRGEPHPMSVSRGPDGRGRNGLWCRTCHQDKNLPGDHMPPGGPGWRLPPGDMPMAFENRTPRQLCEQLKDRARNGERGPREIVEHVRSAPLVLWAWNPGDGRSPVPVPHEEFVGYLSAWAEKGAACPE